MQTIVKSERSDRIFFWMYMLEVSGKSTRSESASPAVFCEPYTYLGHYESQMQDESPTDKSLMAFLFFLFFF